MKVDETQEKVNSGPPSPPNNLVSPPEMDKSSEKRPRKPRIAHNFETTIEFDPNDPVALRSAYHRSQRAADARNHFRPAASEKQDHDGDQKA